MGTKKILHDLDMQSANRLVNLPDPSSAQHAATKIYVDNALLGIGTPIGVKARATGNITISTALNNGDTIDGVVLATGDLVLVDQQTTATEDGIYVVGVTPVRYTGLPVGEDARGLLVVVESGTANATKVFMQTANPAIIGTNGLTMTSITAGVSYTADGNGIELSGTVFNIELDGTTLSKSSAGIRVGSGAAGAGLTEASGVLAVGDGGEGVTINADDVALDFATVARWRTWTGPASAGSTIVQAHGLGKSTLVIQVQENTTGSTWRDITDGVIVETDGTNITVDFGTSQADRSKFRINAVG